MGVQKRFVTGMISGAGSVVIRTLLNLLLIPLLIYSLGGELYGLYVLLIGIIDLFLILDFGFTPSITNLLGAYRSTGQSQKAEEILFIGHALYVGLALFALLLGALFALYIPQLFHLSPQMADLARIPIAIVFLEGVLTLYSSYYRAVLLAHNLNHWTNMGDTIAYITGNSLGILLLLNGFGLPAFLLARLGCALIRLWILVYRSVRTEPTLFQRTASLKPQTLKELVGQSYHALLMNLSVLVSHKIDSFVIACFLPLTAVGIFEIVFRLLGIIIQILLKLSEGAFPAFSRLAALSRKEDAKVVFLRMSCLNNFVALLLLMLVISFYPELFRLLSAGQIPIKPTLPILAVAVPTIWSSALQIPATYYLYTSGRQRFLTISSLITALCNLSLSLILVQPLGLVGVALGTLIPQFLQHQASLIRQACLDLQVSFWQYVRSVHLSVLVPLLFAVFFIRLLEPLHRWGDGSFAAMIGVASVTFCLSSAFWFILTATEQEKQLLRTFFSASARQKPVRDVEMIKR